MIENAQKVSHICLWLAVAFLAVGLYRSTNSQKEVVDTMQNQRSRTILQPMPMASIEIPIVGVSSTTETYDLYLKGLCDGDGGPYFHCRWNQEIPMDEALQMLFNQLGYKFMPEKTSTTPAHLVK